MFSISSSYIMCCKTYTHTKFNPRTCGVGWRGRCHPSLGFSVFVFLNDETSAPEVFCSCSLITRSHFETSLVTAAARTFSLMPLSRCTSTDFLYTPLQTVFISEMFIMIIMTTGRIICKITKMEYINR